MKELVRTIVVRLVDFPEQVSVEEAEGVNSLILKLSVAKADMGKVIGKQGRTAQAIRTLVIAAAGKSKRRILLEIVE